MWHTRDRSSFISARNVRWGRGPKNDEEQKRAKNLPLWLLYSTIVPPVPSEFSDRKTHFFVKNSSRQNVPEFCKHRLNSGKWGRVGQAQRSAEGGTCAYAAPTGRGGSNVGWRRLNPAPAGSQFLGVRSPLRYSTHVTSSQSESLK